MRFVITRGWLFNDTGVGLQATLEFDEVTAREYGAVVVEDMEILIPYMHIPWPDRVFLRRRPRLREGE